MCYMLSIEKKAEEKRKKRYAKPYQFLKQRQKERENT